MEELFVKVSVKGIKIQVSTERDGYALSDAVTRAEG